MIDDWDVIYSYTRKQAIEDGILIDVSNLAMEAGFKIPVAITSNLYKCYIRTALPGQDETGRLWDALWMLFLKARECDKDTIFYDVIFQMSNEKQKIITLKAVIGSGDTLEPVLTIMSPEDD